MVTVKDFVDEFTERSQYGCSITKLGEVTHFMSSSCARICTPIVDDDVNFNRLDKKFKLQLDILKKSWCKWTAANVKIQEFIENGSSQSSNMFFWRIYSFGNCI